MEIVVRIFRNSPRSITTVHRGQIRGGFLLRVFLDRWITRALASINKIHSRFLVQAGLKQLMRTEGHVKRTDRFEEIAHFWIDFLFV